MNHDLEGADFLVFEPKSWNAHFDNIVETARTFFRDNPEKNQIIFDVIRHAHGEVVGRKVYTRHFIENVAVPTA